MAAQSDHTLPVAEGAEAVHGHEVAGGTEAAVHHGEGGGLPQFEFEYWGGQIVWLFLIFAVLYILLATVFVPRFRKIVDERAKTIASAVDEARSVQAEADAQARAAQAEIEEARARARGVAADAKAKASAELAKGQAAEDERLAGELAAAESRIREMRDTAMGNVRTIAADTASAMIEKLTGRAAQAGEIDAALTARNPQGAA